MSPPGAEEELEEKPKLEKEEEKEKEKEMAADEAGNTLEDVAIPVTGAIAYAPKGTALPTDETGAGTELTLDGSFIKLGLVTEDGGPEWTLEKDGDDIEFWQEGYKIPSGMSNVEVKFKLAQTDPTTQEFIRGKKYDAHKHMVVDGGGNPTPFAFWIEEVFKNGTIRRRACANAMIKEVAETKSERGNVMAYEVTVTLLTDSKAHPAGQFHEWLITPGKD